MDGDNEIYDEHSRAVNRIRAMSRSAATHNSARWRFSTKNVLPAFQFIHTHPALTVKLFGRRVIVTWLGTASPWRDFLRADSSLARFIFFWNGLTLIAALVALARLALVRSPFLFPLAVFPLFFPLVYYLTTDFASSSPSVRPDSCYFVRDCPVGG